MEPILIEKSSREVLRLAVEEYKGKLLLSARLWYYDRDGELKPGREGWAMPADALPEVLAGFQKLHDGEPPKGWAVADTSTEA